LDVAVRLFNLSPAAGTPTIERNYARGPGSATLMLRLSRTWAFGGRRENDPNASNFGGLAAAGLPAVVRVLKACGAAAGFAPAAAPVRARPPGMGFNSGRRYTVTLGINAMNALNRPITGPQVATCHHAFFGQHRSLAGGFGPYRRWRHVPPEDRRPTAVRILLELEIRHQQKNVASSVLTALANVVAWAANVTGNWSAQISGPDAGGMTLTVNFKQSGTKLTGTIEGPGSSRCSFRMRRSKPTRSSSLSRSTR
jgi:hypothetical protein